MIVTINDVPYTVILDGMDDDIAGQANPEVCEIKIHKDHSRHQQVRTLYHEIVHIILDQTGHEKLAENEDLVNAIAFGMASVIANNPILALLARGEIDIESCN